MKADAVGQGEIVALQKVPPRAGVKPPIDAGRHEHVEGAVAVKVTSQHGVWPEAEAIVGLVQIETIGLGDRPVLFVSEDVVHRHRAARGVPPHLQ
jgi:hypothetical protein